MRNWLSALQLSVLIPGLVLAAGLAWVGASVAQAASSASPAMASVPETIVDNAFQPSSLTVNVGDSVVWTNTGSRAHTSTSGTGPAPDNRWNSGPLNPGQSFTFTFAAPGVYSYFCQIHPSMTGSITVGGAAAGTPSATPSATPTVTPTGAVGSAAVSLTASPTLSTSTTATATSVASQLTSTPTVTPTSSVPAPTNLQMVSSGPQPGTYTLSWTAPAGVTIQEYRVQSIQATLD